MLKSSENTYTSNFICRLYPAKEARPKRKHKKRYKNKSHDFLFSENKFLSFVYSRSGIYYALFLGCLDLKFVPHIPYCVNVDVAQICNQFLFIIATTERKVRFNVKLFNHFLTEYSSVWAESCRVSS